MDDHPDIGASDRPPPAGHSAKAESVDVGVDACGFGGLGDLGRAVEIGGERLPGSPPPPASPSSGTGESQGDDATPPASPLAEGHRSLDD